MDSLYDLITKEFFEKKSISALLFLLEHGRELSFSVGEEKYSITNDGYSLPGEDSRNKNKPRKYHFDYNGVCEIYDTPYQLIENAKVGEKSLLDKWNEIDIRFLY